MSRLFRLLLAASFAATLAACGGGGSASSQSLTAVAASQVSGTVTGLASVVVDDTEYNDSVMTVSKEVDPTAPVAATTANLQVGQQVELTQSGGNWNNGVIRPKVIGPVESVGASTLTVLGQTVMVSATTTFGGGYTALTDVLANDQAEVHGTLNADGSIQATRIEKETVTAPATPDYVVVGKVAGSTASGFSINALTVSYDATTRILPASTTLADGQVVTVFSKTAPAGTASAPTLATKAIRVHVARTLTGQTILEDGRARNLMPATGTLTRFDIEEFTVDTTAAALVVTTDGMPGTLADIQAGRKVMVQGTVSASSTLVASQIWVKTTASTELLLVGPITAVNGTTFTVRHTTVDFSSTSLTLTNGTATDIVTGAYVVVTGTPNAGTVMADSITFTPVPPDFRSLNLPSVDLPTGWSSAAMPVPPTNVHLPPVGTKPYGGKVSNLATTAGVTSFTLTDSRGMSVTVNESATTVYMPKTTTATSIVNGARVFLLGVLNASGSVDASMIRLMK